MNFTHLFYLFKHVGVSGWHFVEHFSLFFLQERRFFVQLPLQLHIEDPAFGLLNPDISLDALVNATLSRVVG